MVAAQDYPDTPLRMSEAEYLEFEEQSDIKHEFRKGWVYAMTDASVRHNVITGNTITQLNIQLSGKKCSVSTSDTRIHIPHKGTYRYPDISVFCGAPEFVDNRVDTIANPVLLVEVLSPSTAVTDYNEKQEEYTQIPSLQAYLIVSQHTPKVEWLLRYDSGKWLYDVVSGSAGALSGEISLPQFDVTLKLSDIYRNIDWDDAG